MSVFDAAVFDSAVFDTGAAFVVTGGPYLWQRQLAEKWAKAKAQRGKKGKPKVGVVLPDPQTVVLEDIPLWVAPNLSGLSGVSGLLKTDVSAPIKIPVITLPSPVDAFRAYEARKANRRRKIMLLAKMEFDD